MSLTRREMLSISLGAVLLPHLVQPAEARRFVNRTGLKRGQFVWEPSQPHDGPVTIVASLADRLVHVYKAGVLVGISTCHVGLRRRRTPSGVFAISGIDDSEADDDRRSWSGIALHASGVQRYPASPGCIRVPAAFARLLQEIVVPGTAVILAPQRTVPMDVVHSGGLFPIVPVYEAANPMVRPVAQRQGHQLLTGTPEAGPVAVVISRASRSAILLRNGELEHVARVRFVQPNSRIGTHVYSLTGTAPAGEGLVWLAFGIGRSRRERHLVSWHGDELLDQISFEDRASALTMSRALHAGSILVVTDEPATSKKHTTPRNFILISAVSAEPRVRHRSSRRRRRRRVRVVRRRRQNWAEALINSWR
ncbi:MAG TPA: L,D-transpeptidase family protein [Hyphomicrobiaceae bacterium]